MGARPSSFKAGGGGFLNNVDAEIVDYEFTNVFPGGDGGKKSKNSKKSDFNSLYFVLTVKQDGSDDDDTTTLWAGDADAVSISDDGKTIEPAEGEGDVEISQKSALGIFIASLCAAGFPESELPEDGEPVNFEAIIGQRVRLTQQVNEEMTKKLGKRKGKGKNADKEYNRTDLVVTSVYEPEEKSSKSGKSAKSNGKAATKTNGKASKSKKDDDGDDLAEEAEAVLLDVLADAKDGEMPRAKLTLALTRKLVKNENATELRKLIYSEDFLGREAGWSYDGSSKTQTITLDN